MDHLKIINAFNTTHLKIMIDYKSYYLGAFLKHRKREILCALHNTGTTGFLKY